MSDIVMVVIFIYSMGFLTGGFLSALLINKIKGV